MENKFSEYVEKKLIKEADEEIKDQEQGTEDSGSNGNKKSSKTVKDVDIKKVFKLKNFEVDDINHRTDGSIEISMYKEKVTFSKAIDEIAEAIGAKDWQWSGTQENPFRVTFFW